MEALQLDGTESFDIELRLLLEGIFLRYGYDFREYSMASVRRRVRQFLAREGLDTVSGLQARVLHDVDFFTRFLAAFTVPTSEMFRDPEFYRVVREKIVPVLRTYPSLKLWVAGCSTGEEVYSYSIILHEEGLSGRSLIYATDINPEVLRRAKKGVYPAEAIRGFTANYQAAGGRGSLSDYYSARYGAAVFDPALIKNVVFADHSLVSDSVFSETHFVSCRNVMIYFNRRLQDRAIRLFHESLCRGGFLGLGSKETVQFSEYGNRFEPFDRQNRIWRKAR